MSGVIPGAQQQPLADRIESSQVLTRLQKAAETNDWAELKSEEAQETATLLTESAACIRALETQIAPQTEAQKAVLVLIDLALDCWEQFAFRADDGSLWDGGLSTLERLEGILGPLGLLNERQEAARPLPVLPFGNDDEVVVTAARTLLGAQS